ncbi:hypothetical protein CK203_037347 [Vitis vinifera]|uniref:Retrotransposon gag domain-containing protein n=1 Tax=Vitis vinifera TaxID=29760 RepID=A0A438H965_VITVI|nr:hypothetical protein CK203_037347 [Vitis vinifera]
MTFGHNSVWSQLVEMHIAKWEKLSYIREIMKRYLHLPTAQEIWSALSKAFYDGSDELQVFTLNQKAFTAKQSGRSLSEYYGGLTEIFCELDHWDKVVMKDPEDIATYWKSIERQRDQSKTNHPKTDPNIDKSTFKCTHYNKSGHTKSRCFEIVGYPDWWDHNRDQRKKDSKKTLIAIVAEIKTEANVVEKASALVAATGYGANGNITPVIGERSLTPHRHNRGIPKPTYEPELSTKVQYPMNNYVSNHRLSESNKSFVNQLSTITIPNSVQEVLVDPRWKTTMNEEMKSLQKNET